MKPKIFITPWIDLSNTEVQKCIDAGANSGRIHTGKANAEKIIDLIKFYDSIDFKFYLDLRGNKASVDFIDSGNEFADAKIGDSLWIYENTKYYNLKSADIKLRFNYFPASLSNMIDQKSDFALDDGNILLTVINKEFDESECLTGLLCKVTRANSKKIWIGDGITSSNYFIHSNNKSVLTKIDIKILESIPQNIRDKVKYAAVSFCENQDQISDCVKTLQNLGYNSAQVVPKIETAQGVKNIDEICLKLHKLYKGSAEVQIGRSDLSLDSKRLSPPVNADDLTDKAIKTCRENHVKISILALILQSVRKRHKLNQKSNNWKPSLSEYNYIKHLCKCGVYQIGLTNDMYIDRPELMINALSNTINMIG